MVAPLLSLEVATPESESIRFDAVIHMQEKLRLTKAVLGIRMQQFTLHGTRRTPHGASRLVLAMSA